MVKIYQARVPLDQDASLADIVEVARDWIVKSPHKKIQASSLENLGEDGFKLEYNGITIKALKELDEPAIWAMRMTEHKGEDVYESDIVGVHGFNRLEVVYSLSYLSHNPRPPVQKRPPILVRHLVEAMPTSDVSLPISTNPRWIQEDQMDLVRTIMQNQYRNKLPIVYLSKDQNNWTDINPKHLAKRLVGVAHVLVEPSRGFSMQLGKRVDGKNAYNGAVGIYWPNGKFWICLPEGPGRTMYNVFAQLRDRAISEVLPDELRFDSLVSKRRETTIEELKKKADEAANKALEGLVEETERKDILIGELRETILRMENELCGESEQHQMIQDADLKELYPGEIRDLISESLQSYQQKLETGTRRHEMIRELVRANPTSGGRDRIYRGLQNALKSGRNMAKVRRLLKKIGFDVIHDSASGHPSLIVPGYENIKEKLPGTSSDVRTARNTASKIRKKLL